MNPPPPSPTCVQPVSYDPVVNKCVCGCVCGWLDCYIHYSGLLTLLVIIHTCLLETVRERFLIGWESHVMPCIYNIRGQEEYGWRSPSISSPHLRFFPVCQRGMWSDIAMSQRGQFTVLSSFLYFKSLCNSAILYKSKYMSIPVYSIICFLSM